jgi:hypothetical protein
VSHKVQVVLPDPVARQLQELAAAGGEPPSTLAAQLVRHGVALAAKEGRVRPLRGAPVLTGSNGAKRPRWLEPYGGERAWRAQMWGAIVALHGRYPRALAALKEGWWSDEAHAERLCALAVWRSDLDEEGVDPREELAFHNNLADYTHVLRQEGGGVSRAWKPGAPPREWAG